MNVLGAQSGLWRSPGMSVPLPVRMLSPALCKTSLREKATDREHAL